MPVQRILRLAFVGLDCPASLCPDFECEAGGRSLDNGPGLELGSASSGFHVNLFAPQFCRDIKRPGLGKPRSASIFLYCRRHCARDPDIEVRGVVVAFVFWSACQSHCNRYCLGSCNLPFRRVRAPLRTSIC